MLTYLHDKVQELEPLRVSERIFQESNKDEYLGFSFSFFLATISFTQ